jgi:serine/threonine protein kinase
MTVSSAQDTDEMAAPVDAANAEELELLRASTLGEYEILGELGRGGMATVYAAHDIALDRRVAIKVISPSLGASPALVERFRREARTAASLSHPNIIPIYSVRHSNRLLFFVMKYVEGRPLDSILRETGALPVPTVQAVLGQVASAVGYAHRHGVVHRDIKPGNIIIDDEGWCVVTDFGIAKVAESEGLTTSGMMVGTPAYMSPEQCLSNNISGASDQYALGVVAYEMLTGRLPFPGTSMMSVMYAHVHVPVPEIADLRAECPPDLATAVMRMLSKEPTERWPSIEEAVAALGQVTASQDEPTRNQLITLATTGARPLTVRYTTPRSPIPFQAGNLALSSDAKTVQIGKPENSFRTIAVVVALVGVLLASAVYFAPWRRAARAEEPVAVPTIPASTDASNGAATATGTPAPVAPVTGTANSTAAGTHKPVRPANSGPAAASAAPAPAPAPTTTAIPAVAVAIVDMEEPSADSGRREISGSDALLNRVGAPGAVAPDTRAAIERAVKNYGQALVLGDVAEAVARYPGIPAVRQEQITAFFATGGRYSLRWKITDLRVTGTRAEAQLSGSTTEIRAGVFGSTRVVDEHITLERRGNLWILTQIAQ